MESEVQELIEETAGIEAAETTEAETATETVTAKDDDAGKDTEKAKLEEKPAGEVSEKPAAGTAEPDVEAILDQHAKPTAPGGAPAGVIRDLREERRARREAEQRARDLEARLAAQEVQRTVATQKFYSVQDLIDQGRITPDDVVTAGMQAEIARNCRDRDRVEKESSEQQKKTADSKFIETVDAQIEQLSAAMKAANVPASRSFERVFKVGNPLLSQKDQAEIAALIRSGKNGAVEIYRRCANAIVAEYPELKDSILDKPKSPGKKTATTETKKEKTTAEDLSQEELLEREDKDGFLARQIS